MTMTILTETGDGWHLRKPPEDLSHEAKALAYLDACDQRQAEYEAQVQATFDDLLRECATEEGANKHCLQNELLLEELPEMARLIAAAQLDTTPDMARLGSLMVRFLNAALYRMAEEIVEQHEW